MTQEEKDKIISNDYVDLLIDYNGIAPLLNKFQNATIRIINEKFAVVHIPFVQVATRVVELFGYSVIPLCFGLESQSSLDASGIPRLRSIPNFDLRGQGVLVGIVDTGIDYTNPIFQYKDNTTRIISIWDQTIDSEDRYPNETFYGTEYSGEQINQALRSDNPLSIVPSMDEIGHGTMLAGVAAGSEVEESGFYGVAPETELVIVKLKQAKEILKGFFMIPENAICYQENDIIQGVQYLSAVARRLRRPIAICIGLGSSQGSHDGRGSLATYLSVVGNIPGNAIITSAGNEGNARSHYYGVVDPDIGYNTVELNVGENESGFSMQIWGNSPGTYSIDILSPEGEYIPRIAETLVVNQQISFVFENTIIYINYQMVESITGDQLILLRFKNPTAGIWRIKVYGRGDLTLAFHIWLPIQSFISGNTYFTQPNPDTTVLSPGNSAIPITATAYNDENNSLYLNASRGYTRTTNIIKPELTAPGVNILSPTLNHEFASVTGTSTAAAHTTGVAAMILEWGILRGNYTGIDTVEIKKFLIRGAKRNVNIIYPNREWGYGILDIYNVFDQLRTDTTRNK